MGPYGRLSAIALTGVLLDQSLKWTVFQYLATTQRWDITCFLSLVLSRNKGGVFGVIQGANYLFILFSVLALFLLLWVYERSDKGRLSTSLAMGCVLAGAVGNLIDRLAYNYVRDFIDLHVGMRHWPTFNLADVFLCVGVGLMAWKTLAPGSPGQPTKSG
ncbi:MAG TPA: signal peptidase II [Candidatus Brocadiales bacterium]|nr:signal peptidase II [Candidatus Brocadiales bacterium]